MVALNTTSAAAATTARPPGVVLRDLSLGYADAAVLGGIDMEIESGKWTCLLGVSGCGKTSLLRCIAGLAAPQVWSSGEVIADDGRPLAQRIAWMAQSDLLLPWLSVADNVCLGARLRGNLPEPHRIAEILTGVKLADGANANDSANASATPTHARLPHTLSGGMRQRVALARCLYEERPLNLMDEPFSRLDAITRHDMQDLAARLLQNRTVLLVTHDPLEALRLGHRLFVLSGDPARARELPLPGAPPRDLGQPGIAALLQSLLDELAGLAKSAQP